MTWAELKDFAFYVVLVGGLVGSAIGGYKAKSFRNGKSQTLPGKEFLTVGAHKTLCENASLRMQQHVTQVLDEKFKEFKEDFKEFYLKNGYGGRG